MRQGLTVISASGEMYQSSENEEAIPVLPVVHTLWPHLVVRVTDSDSIPIFSMLPCLSKFSFIRE